MIATWHAGPVAGAVAAPRDRRDKPRKPIVRGSPLAVLAVLLALWVGVRVLAWEDPFSAEAMAYQQGPASAAGAARSGEQGGQMLGIAQAQVQAQPSRQGPKRALNVPIGAMSYADPSRDPLLAGGAGYGFDPFGRGGWAAWNGGGAPFMRPIVQYLVLPGHAPGAAFAGRAAGAARGDRASYRQPAPGYPPGAGAPYPFAYPHPYPGLADRIYHEGYGALPGLATFGSEDLRLARAQDATGAPGAVPFGGSAARAPRSRPDRWSLDAWAFMREGSDAAPITQGRVPIYGASQIGAIAQWRARPGNGHDPRLYGRAYSALVANGETELALGGSIRPIPAVPVRAAGELRVTQSPFSTDVRPAGYAVTELAPFPLGGKISGELYAGAGYVGGEADTAFIDGQFALTRPVVDYNPTITRRVKLSLGAGAWGGAQRGASRLDIGPTMRLDMLFGSVPARVSLDWRERVTGDAAPESGIAATVSTSF